MKVRTKLVLLIATLVLSAGPATAEPALSISTPEEGSEVQGPTVTLAGAVTFDEPLQSVRTFYLRRDGCPGSPIDTSTGNMRLSITSGTDTSESCIWPNSAATALTPRTESYPAVDGVPFSLDASRAVSGNVRLASLPVAAGQATVDVRVSGVTTKGQSVQIGQRCCQIVTVLPGQGPVDHAWSFTPSSTYHGLDFVSMSMSVTVRGASAGFGYIVYGGASWMNMPIHTASLDRRVEVSLDGGTATAATLAPSLRSWDAVLEGLETGQHSVEVRARQGWTSSPPVSRGFISV